MDKKASKKAYKEKLLNEFRESLPMDERKFLPLFDFLDSELSREGCKNDFTLLDKYCKKENLDATPLKEWFRKHGGYCDCEIIANVEDEFGYLTKPIISEIPHKRKQTTVQCKKIDTLQTDFGFAINKVPAPWMLVAISEGEEVNYQFRVGKKTNFPLSLVDEFPIEKLSDDKYLHKYWIQKTDLDYELEFVIERQNVQDFELVYVRTQSWTPVFLFVFRNESKWCLMMETEIGRLRNTIKDLEGLLKEINISANNGKA